MSCSISSLPGAVHTWRHEWVDGIDCPLCGDKQRKEWVLRVTAEGGPKKSRADNEHALDLYRCAGCQVRFFWPLPSVAYDSVYDSTGLKYFWELNTGIEAMAASLVRVKPPREKPRMLDLGCGLGFSVDFASKALGWDAVGVDPSPMGRAGRDELGAPIEVAMLEDVEALRDQRFDVVHCAEVLEHVTDPAGFVQMLLGHLDDDGVLILSTPNAEQITPQVSGAIVLSILSPGLHVFLFPPQELRRWLESMGCAHVEVFEEGERLLVYASRKPLELSEAAGRLQPLYQKYLDEAMARRSRHDSIFQGLAQRRFTQMVNRNEPAAAFELLETIQTSLREQYGQAALDPKQVIRATKGVPTLSELGERLPYFITPLYYHWAMLVLNERQDYEEAAARFRAAFEFACAQLAFCVDGQTADLQWKAKFHEGLALQKAGKRFRARRCFKQILANRDRTRRRFGHNASDAESAERAEAALRPPTRSQAAG